jgi:hypothetical protein
VSKPILLEKKYVCKLGFWAAIVATVLFSAAGITATLAIQPFATLVGFLLTPAFLIIIACVHSYASEEKKVFGLIGLSFAIIYAALISTNYFIQLTYVNQTTFDASMFEMSNPQSMMWVIEILGYTFMGLATLFAAPIFGSARTENLVKWLFIANGVLGVLTPIGYLLNLPPQVLYGGLMVWDAIMPVSTAALTYVFWSYRRTL